MPATDDEIKNAACDLTHKFALLCGGQPTASVYMAIAYTLGSMEMLARKPDREGLFQIISGGMDEYIENATGSVRHNQH